MYMPLNKIFLREYNSHNNKMMCQLTKAVTTNNVLINAVYKCIMHTYTMQNQLMSTWVYAFQLKNKKTI